MTIKNKLEQFALERDSFQIGEAREAVARNFSRQTIYTRLMELVKEGKLLRSGSGRGAFYYHISKSNKVGEVFRKVYRIKEVQGEDLIADEIKGKLSRFVEIPENVANLFDFAFTEMMNNAIDHSHSNLAEIEVVISQSKIYFYIRDFGIGVFRSIKQKRNLNSELEAMQDLLKGKTTTAPLAHSGEGIFFTSKVADRFKLQSYNYILEITNIGQDIYFGETEDSLEGTAVSFEVSLDSDKHLNEVFKAYYSKRDVTAFDTTSINIDLYKSGSIYISRSQAKRILVGLDKFKKVTLDFKNISVIGQSFADEVFRVFKKQHPDIEIIPINMNSAVRFMIERVDELDLASIDQQSFF